MKIHRVHLSDCVAVSFRPKAGSATVVFDTKSRIFPGEFVSLLYGPDSIYFGTIEHKSVSRPGRVSLVLQKGTPIEGVVDTDSLEITFREIPTSLRGHLRRSQMS